MAKYLDFEGLTKYDTKLKEYIEDGSSPFHKAEKTLLTSAWNDKSLTLTVDGINAGSYISYKPTPASRKDFIEAEIFAVSQGTDSIAFECENEPTSDIDISLVFTSPLIWGWENIITQDMTTRAAGSHVLPPLPIKEDCTIYVTFDESDPYFLGGAGGEFGSSIEVWAKTGLDISYVSISGARLYPNSEDYYEYTEEKIVGEPSDELILRVRNSESLSFTILAQEGIEVTKGDAIIFYVNLWANMEAPLKVIFRENSLSGEEIFSYYIYDNNACYLTTVMVDYYGKDDDGPELTAMRKLRAYYANELPEILKEYAIVSRHIIKNIEVKGNKEYWYNKIREVVDGVVLYVEAEDWESAKEAYLALYYELKDIFYGEAL